MSRTSDGTWTRPQLIVLGRGKPEENVLGSCKTPQGADHINGPLGEGIPCQAMGNPDRCEVVSAS